MTRSAVLVALCLLSAAAGPSVAQEEWPQPAGHGVDRASAAGKPNEAGALPESSLRAEPSTPDGAQDTGYGATTSAPAEPSETAADSTRAPEVRALPATASPLSAMAVSGVIFLAAAGGLYRLRREPQH